MDKLGKNKITHKPNPQFSVQSIKVQPIRKSIPSRPTHRKAVAQPVIIQPVMIFILFINTIKRTNPEGAIKSWQADRMGKLLISFRFRHKNYDPYRMGKELLLLSLLLPY